MSYSEDTSITTEQSLQRQQRRRQRRSLSIASAVKGRVLAPGSFVGTNLWQLSRHSRGRGLLGQLRGENVVIRAFSAAAAAEQHPQQKQHSEYHCQLRRNADNFVVRNAAGKAILQCITTTTNTATAAGSHNDNNKKKKSSLSILYGTRPLIAGNPATHRAHGGQFYPWYVVAMGSDGGVTVELYNAKQAVLWSSCGGCSERVGGSTQGSHTDTLSEHTVRRRRGQHGSGSYGDATGWSMQCHDPARRRCGSRGHDCHCAPTVQDVDLL